MTNQEPPSKPKLQVNLVVVGPLFCNCVIVSDPVSKEILDSLIFLHDHPIPLEKQTLRTNPPQAIIVDPGGDAASILHAVDLLNVSVKSLYHTHAHLDHCLASRRIKRETGAKVYVHREDLFLWERVEEQAKYIGVRIGPEDVPDTPDGLLSGNEDLYLGGEVVGKVIHTPGHSPGSICFYFFDHVVCTGDTLFRDSVGRFDLWRSSFPDLKRSIQTKLYSLPASLPVIPGHGPSTTIGREREVNQFIRGDEDSVGTAVTGDGGSEEEEEEEDEDDDGLEDDDGIEDVLDDIEAVKSRAGETFGVGRLLTSRRQWERIPTVGLGGCACCLAVTAHQHARI
ncbi:hypothetical protein HDU96_007581 [Phlyctochytrium bullatum]|nr:hypothetical protein HDU96_007581 [Phlyctochytrium bullatum]